MEHLNIINLPVLLVDDEPQILASFGIMLKGAGIREVLAVSDSRLVMPLLAEREISVIVMDISMPHVKGTMLLPEINHAYPHIPVIMMTALNDLDIAVECMRMGAFDYLVKPVELSRFETSIKRALEMRALKSEAAALKKHLLHGRIENEEAFSDCVTTSKKMRAIFQYIEVIAGTDQPVLITGETGAGKELIAGAIHRLSGRGGEFVAVNLAGLDDTMFSDTLFGHKKGAYTGADETRDGFISKAGKGTLFLDEIGDANESSQVKLLRLLQEHQYYPLGSDAPKRSEARIVVATNRDLQRLIREGRFRMDLYYRLRAHQIHIPALRERKEDLPALLRHFIAKASTAMSRKPPSYPQELDTLMSTYHFPGNVRELESMVFDAVARHKGGVLSMDSFKQVINMERGVFEDTATDTHALPSDALSLDANPIPTLKKAQEALVARAMELANGNQGIAAGMLGITRQALNKRLSKAPRGRDREP
ncbi:MAG: sigma-54-dependent Fis family transcriptional regulator [Deltaproteobacteria bacterium]|nr:sigma-54-dependent Fis family transcriptional regulator [Deltaproteobacteria bacterium]